MSNPFEDLKKVYEQAKKEREQARKEERLTEIEKKTLEAKIANSLEIYKPFVEKILDQLGKIIWGYRETENRYFLGIEVGKKQKRRKLYKVQFIDCSAFKANIEKEVSRRGSSPSDTLMLRERKYIFTNANKLRFSRFWFLGKDDNNAIEIEPPIFDLEKRIILVALEDDSYYYPTNYKLTGNLIVGVGPGRIGRVPENSSLHMQITNSEILNQVTEVSLTSCIKKILGGVAELE